MSKWRKALYWLCGVEKYINKSHREEESYDEKATKIDTSIDQTPTARNLCDVNAVIAMAVCSFIYAFFNKFSNY